MNALLVATALLIGVDPPKGNVGTVPSGGVGRAPGGNVGSFPGGNVGSYPRGNVDVYPRGNVDRYPSGNVSIYPRGNVDRIPQSNAGSDTGGNVDTVPSGDAGSVPADPTSPKKAAKSKKTSAKEKVKPDAASDSKSKKTAAKKKDDKAAEKTAEKKNEPGVTGPWLLGSTAWSGAVIAELERTRDRLNDVGHDYKGRRAAAIMQIAHAIHNLKYGHSDPHAAASVGPIKKSESRWTSDGKLTTAHGELMHVAGRLRTGAYLYGSPALNAVERAIEHVDAALKEVFTTK